MCHLCISKPAKCECRSGWTRTRLGSTYSSPGATWLQKSCRNHRTYWYLYVELCRVWEAESRTNRSDWGLFWLFLATAIAAVDVQYPCRRPRLFPPVCPIICTTTNYIFATLSHSSVFGLIFTVFLAFHLFFFDFVSGLIWNGPQRQTTWGCKERFPWAYSRSAAQSFLIFWNPTPASSKSLQSESYYGLDVVDGCTRPSSLLSFNRISTSTFKSHKSTVYSA